MDSEPPRRLDSDPDRAVVHHRHNLEQHPLLHFKRDDLLNDLAAALFRRFEQLERMNDLEEAIAHFYHSLALRPPGHQHRFASLNNLAGVVSTRFEQLGQMDDLAQTIQFYGQALVLFPPSHPDRSACLGSLGSALSTRFRELGQLEDLQEAIKHFRQCLALRPHNHPDRPVSLNNLACAILARFGRLRKMEDQEEVIKFSRQALVLNPPGHPDHSISLNNLAGATSIRFQQLGQTQDIEETIKYRQQALSLFPPSHPGRTESLNNLASALFARFEQLGQMDDLEEALQCYRQTLVYLLPGHQKRARFLTDLANAVSVRFKKLEQKEDLQEAIQLHRQALVLLSPDHPNRTASLNHLADTIFTRFQQLGHIDDLEEAIEYHKQALVLCPPEHLYRSTFLNNLASEITTRFMHLGQMEDLEEAIKLHRQALVLRSPGHPDRSSSLNNLAAAIITRYQQLGQMEDLEEVIELLRQALVLLPGHENHSSSLMNLASALDTRFRQLRQMQDLEEAIKYHRQSLVLCPPGFLQRSSSLNNLAVALRTRFDQLGEMEDLQEGIEFYQEALDLFPPGHPESSALLSNLAMAVSTRFDQLGQLEDLEVAVKFHSDAVKVLPSRHPSHASVRSGLACSILKLCYHSTPSDHTVQMTSDAFALFKSATHHSTSFPHDHFLAARRWVQAARRFGHSSLLRAYSTAFTCLGRRATLTPTVHSWQKFLASVPRSLASDAASSAIEEGSLESAVELLEQGRAILWSKMQGYRHSYHQLWQVDADLADEFGGVSSDLERHTMAFEVKSPPVGFFDRQVEKHRILSKNWDEVVQRIRQIDGFTDFLQAVPFASLQMAAAEGPVIIVNVSEYRSDAIIIQQFHAPVLVCLPRASPRTFLQLSLDLSSALALDPNRSTRIFPILRTLWELVVSPVVDQLAILGVAEMSRIWWCPTSELCGLPLHAAGSYESGRKNLPNIYISSYTPSLSSLIRARSNVKCRLSVPKLLVMGQPDDNNGSSKLPYVREEIRRIHGLGESVDVLLGEQATSNTLLPCLQENHWIHFACHGHMVAKEPFRSYFQLHNNERLTLGDLIKARLSNAEFAFLSACHSAAIDVTNTPDEAIHFAAALQFCGFRSVVGTLWAMADVDGPDVADDFYWYMFRKKGGTGDFRGSAVALNYATRMMRKRGVPVDRWINFVHIGA